MKYLGIDFGTKNIGIAISDDEGAFAFPLKTIKNSESSIQDILDLAKEENISKIILGDPGEDETVQATKQKVLEFKKDLEKDGVEIVLQPEFMTSLHTDLFNKKKPVARKWGSDRKEKKDESAAALILQRFLDLNNN